MGLNTIWSHFNGDSMGYVLDFGPRSLLAL